MVAAEMEAGPARCPRRGISDVFNFDHIRKDPWLEGKQFSSRDEQSELERNRSTRIYRKATQELELHMQLATVREKTITRENNDYQLSTEPDHPRRLQRQMLRVLQQGANRKPAKLLAKYPIIQEACILISVQPYSLLACLFVVYLIMKWLTVGFLYYKRDVLLTNVKISNVVRLNESCGRLMIVEPADALDRLRWYAELFNSTGAVLSLFPGVCITFKAAVGCTLMAFFGASLLLLNAKQFQLQCLNFLLDPIEERARADRELRALASDLTSLSGVNTSKYTRSTHLHLSIYKTPTPENAPSDFEFKRTVQHIISAGLVRPANLTSHWHWCLAYSSRVFNICGISISFILTIASLAGMAALEIHLRTKKRLAMLDCERVNATLLDQWNFYLDPLTSKEHERAFSVSNDTSLGHLIHLLLIESTYYLTPMRLWFFIELAISAALFTMWASLYTTFYALDFLSHFIWLTQIVSQVRQCIYTCLSLLQSMDQEVPKTKEWATLTKRITVVYLHTELFRRRHVNLQKFSGFLFEIWIILVVTTFLITYRIVTEVKPKFIVTIVLTTFAFGMVFNGFMATLAYKSREIERLLTACKSLLCHCSVSPIKDSYILDRWRHQILNGREPWESFASSIFTLVVSYEHCIAVNLYLVALWVLIYIRSNNS